MSWIVRSTAALCLAAAAVGPGCERPAGPAAPPGGANAAGADTRPARPEPAPAAQPEPAPAPATPAARDPVRPSDDPRTARFLGLEAPKPATWIEQPPTSAMRKAEYTVPGRDGHPQARVVVFFFAGSGGSVELNIARWQSQFRPGPDGSPPEPVVETLEADGMKVTLVELRGDWMRMGAPSHTPDQVVLHAIVEAPAGPVFIQFAGTTATVEANLEDFRTMILGLKKGGGS